MKAGVTYYNKILYRSIVNVVGHLCECCKTKPSKFIDHNHSTGKLRGLVCNGCNHIIGLYEKYGIEMCDFTKVLKHKSRTRHRANVNVSMVKAYLDLTENRRLIIEI